MIYILDIFYQLLNLPCFLFITSLLIFYDKIFDPLGIYFGIWYKLGIQFFKIAFQ